MCIIQTLPKAAIIVTILHFHAENDLVQNFVWFQSDTREPLILFFCFEDEICITTETSKFFINLNFFARKVNTCKSSFLYYVMITDTESDVPFSRWALLLVGFRLQRSHDFQGLLGSCWNSSRWLSINLKVTDCSSLRYKFKDGRG